MFGRNQVIVKNGGVYAYNWCCIRVVGTDCSKWGALEMDFDGDLPPTGHWLSLELNAVGQLSYLLDMAPQGSDLVSKFETFLLKEGLAPEQPFWVEMTYSAQTGYDDGAEIQWKVVAVSPLPIEEAVERWTDFGKRKEPPAPWFR